MPVGNQGCGGGGIHSPKVTQCEGVGSETEIQGSLRRTWMMSGVTASQKMLDWTYVCPGHQRATFMGRDAEKPLPTLGWSGESMADLLTEQPGMGPEGLELFLILFLAAFVFLEPS